MIKNRTLRVATRGSQLARIQTDGIVRELQKQFPDLRCEIITINTTGDRIIDRSLDRVGGKGLFTEELERAILNHEVDLAVHSLKDLPTELPAGLALGALPERQDARDALVGLSIKEIQNPSRPIRIGTSSLRRFAQLRRLFPQINVVTLRGNVDTRIRKVREGVVDGAVLALAGLRRLEKEHEVSAVFEVDEILPAPGQGALAVEIRNEDKELRQWLGVIHSPETEVCVTAERTFLQRLGGGCQVPVGAHAVIHHDTLTLTGNVISLDGKTLREGVSQGKPDDAANVGHHLAEELLRQGANQIIEEIQREQQEGRDD